MAETWPKIKEKRIAEKKNVSVKIKFQIIAKTSGSKSWFNSA